MKCMKLANYFLTENGCADRKLAALLDNFCTKNTHKKMITGRVVIYLDLLKDFFDCLY